jgi:putative ABC transport system permease protein
VVISRSLAERLFGSSEAALGHRLHTSRAPEAPLRTVVGVASDVRQVDLRDSMREAVYVPQAQTPERNLGFLLRTSVPPMALAPAVRQELRSLDAAQPLSDLATLTQVVDDNALVVPRVTMALLGTFALVSLLLTAVGLYGVMSYAVSQRGREIGIRLALGARKAQVMGLVVRQGMWPALVGLAVGIPAAVLAGQSLQAILVGVPAADPLTICSVTLFLCAVGLIASCAPALRAARTDPAVTMRVD